MIFNTTSHKGLSIRCSRPLCSSQSTGGTLPSLGFCQRKKGPEERFIPDCRSNHVSTGPSGPNSVRHAKLPSHPVPNLPKKIVLTVNQSVLHQCQCSTHERRATLTGLLRLSPITGCIQTEENVLLRKEVIQPHLPVRLPCYDLVLITNPTFDSSSLTVRPLASGVTDFHDLTGGVYKARERIHRSVADLRLLATPTS